jgi:hypothetical protein
MTAHNLDLDPDPEPDTGPDPNLGLELDEPADGRFAVDGALVGTLCNLPVFL